MGVSMLYSAIPPSSTLYARLQHERAFSILMVALFPYGNGIFRFFEIEPEEVDEILEDVIDRHQDEFGSESAAQVIDEFRSELEYTRRAYPGIENRTASLEKSSTKIERRLLQELSSKQIANVDEFVEKLISGDQTFAPALLTADESLGLISRELVSEGANVLRGIDPEMLFLKDSEDWYLSDLKYWRNLYLAADANNEEILVGIA